MLAILEKVLSFTLLIYCNFLNDCNDNGTLIEFECEVEVEHDLLAF